MSLQGNESSRVYEKTPDKLSSNKILKKESKFQFLKKISVEPCTLLLGLGFSLIVVQVSTLYIQKTCKVGSYFFGNETFSNAVKRYYKL